MRCEPFKHLPISTGRIGIQQESCEVTFYAPPYVYAGQLRPGRRGFAGCGGSNSFDWMAMMLTNWDMWKFEEP
jgi:hypothetical protein